MKSGTHNDMDESQKHYTEWKNSGAFNRTFMSLVSSKAGSQEILFIVDDPKTKA